MNTIALNHNTNNNNKTKTRIAKYKSEPKIAKHDNCVVMHSMKHLVANCYKKTSNYKFQ